MTARATARRARATRWVGWSLMAAVFGFLMWIVLGGAAHAESPKAAARVIGNAGNAAARTIARDPANAADVPGYAGTSLPERSLTASGMEDAARVRLADPDDPGGAAGRAVIRGTTLCPAASVPAGDPAVVRSEHGSVPLSVESGDEQFSARAETAPEVPSRQDRAQRASEVLRELAGGDR